ncbi:MAG: hypothetical protein AAF488_13715 [Planctomycetota bacterium]
MKKTTALLAMFVFAIGFAGSATGVLWAQRKKGPGMKEVQGGVIPQEFGELVAAGGDANSTTLVFRKANNDLGLVKMRGTKVPQVITIIKRDY